MIACGANAAEAFMDKRVATGCFSGSADPLTNPATG
jgi:hypothetical protein